MWGDSWVKPCARLIFLVVLASYWNETALLADIVLPGSLPMETNGTYLSSDGSLKRVQRVQQPPSGYDNTAILEAILQGLDSPCRDKNGGFCGKTAKRGAG